MGKQADNTGRQQKKKRVQRFVTVRAPPGRRDLTPWNKGRDGGGLRRRIKEWMWDGDRGRRRAGRQADNPGVGSGGVRTPGRRTTNRVQGWDDGVRSQGGSDGGRSQGEDRQEQEEPGGTQATITMVAHGGADRGRSHGGGMAADYRGPTNGGGAGGGGARGSDREPKSQDEAEDPEGQGGAGGFGD